MAMHCRFLLLQLFVTAPNHSESLRIVDKMPYTHSLLLVLAMYCATPSKAIAAFQHFANDGASNLL